MFDDGLISIIIPIFNVKPYLSECINSVLNQTYENIEIILIDDGSTDGSGEICDNYKHIDKRIKVIHKENAGLGYARNSGLEIAKGDYVTFIDSDDYVSERYVELLYCNALKNNVDECKMGFQRVNNNHEAYAESRYVDELFVGNEAKTIFAPRLIGSAPDKHDSIEMCVCGALFNNKIIRENKLFFPNEREILSEDIIFQLKFSQYARGACLISENCYYYRNNETSLTHSYKKNRYNQSRYLYEYIINFLKQNGYSEEDELRAQRNLFLNVKGSIEQEILFKGQAKSEAIKKIRDICRDEFLKNIIKRYPVNKMKIKQRMFIYLIKYGCCRTLYNLKKLKFY